jgi:predicted nuclease with RNAse H fold
MITLGIDLSSAKKNTVACAIEWEKTRAVVRPPERQCDDDKLDELIADATVVGIDAPFGWPTAFVEAVASWKSTVWSPAERKCLQFRETDLEVQRELGIWPLSVSSDRIALPAMRAMALLERHKVRNRAGDGKFFEVYPAASLKVWGLDCRGYKNDDEKCVALRRGILRGLRRRLQWLEFSGDYAQTSDELDALIASLTVRVASQGLTMKPTRGQLAAARNEGWIHLPTTTPTL